MPDEAHKLIPKGHDSELVSCNEAKAGAKSLPKLTGRIIPPKAEDIEDIRGTILHQLRQGGNDEAYLELE